MKRLILLVIVSLVLFLFIYPAAFLHSSDSLPDDNDTRLIAYLIGQSQQNLLQNNPLFYGTFFAPDHNTLAYSDLFFTSALLTLPFRLFTNSPVVIFNLALIVGFSLTFFTAFFLFDYLFKNPWLTTICTLLFCLSGFHFTYLPHLQMFSLWPLCLATYLFLRFQNENRPHYLTLVFSLVTFQILESLFLVYLIFFTLFILFLAKPQQFKTILLRLLPFVPIWFYLTFPYLHLHYSYPEASRSIRDAAHFSLGLEEVFTKYHGFTVLVLFFALLPLTQKITKLKPWWKIFWFSLVLSLGPVVKLLGQTVKILGLPIPLPYTLFYYLFPGFTGFRTPSRFIVLTLLSTTIIIGYSLLPFMSKLKTPTKMIFLFLILSLLLLELRPPLSSYYVNATLPSVYQEVQQLPPNAIIIELPVKLWNDNNHQIESLRSLYSLKHQHRRFGGFSGFATNAWIDLVQKINSQRLTDKNLSQLRLLGITHVVENNRLYPLP